MTLKYKFFLKKGSNLENLTKIPDEQQAPLFQNIHVRYLSVMRYWTLLIAIFKTKTLNFALNNTNFFVNTFIAKLNYLTFCCIYHCFWSTCH